MHYAREDSKPRIASWIEAAMEHAGMNQSELARAIEGRLRIGFDRSKINKIILCKRGISAEEMLAIQDVTGYAIPHSLLPYANQ